MIINLHMGTWFMAVVLFIIAYVLINKSKEKGAKITSMLARLFYLLIIGTGGYMVINWGFQGQHLIKTVLGIITIGTMEYVLSSKTKGRAMGIPWVSFVVSLAATVFYGYYI